jgi:hypothetical protein
VKLAQFSVPPLADHLAVTHDNRSDERIRADSAPSALRKLKRSQEMPSIRGCELRVHAVD